jgi:nucleoside phosphorylase
VRQSKPVKAPLAIVAAMRAELRPLLGRVRVSRAVRRDGQRFVAGDLDGRRALLTVTGVGGRAAAAGACRTLEELSALGWHEASVLVIGVAGGLGPEARFGEVFVFESCRRFDGSDRETGRLELAVPRAEPASGRKAAELLTLDRVVAHPAAKSELWRRLASPAAAAVDMETYYSAERFTAAGRQVMAVRAISDGPDDALPPWLADCTDPEGGLSQTKVAMRAVARPFSVPALLDLRRRVAHATAQLCTTVRELLVSSP